MSIELTWALLITSLPCSRRASHAICRVCACVGPTYNTADPEGASKPAAKIFLIARLDLPHRRPATITLNLAGSCHTSICQGRSSHERLAIMFP